MPWDFRILANALLSPLHMAWQPYLCDSLFVLYFLCFVFQRFLHDVLFDPIDGPGRVATLTKRSSNVFFFLLSVILFRHNSICPIVFWLQLVCLWFRGWSEPKLRYRSVYDFFLYIITEVSLTHLPVGLGECPRIRSACPPLFVGELDVASGINGVNVVHKIPHLTPLYQF